MTTEKKVADTILQKATKIQVGGETYNVPQPTLATLILVSEEVSKIPPIKIDTENIALESIANAKYAVNLCSAISVMILGAKKINSVPKCLPFWPLTSKKREFSAQKELTNELLEELTPKEISNLFSKLLGTMQVDFFLGTLISLTEINLLKEKKTIASGQ